MSHARLNALPIELCTLSCLRVQPVCPICTPLQTSRPRQRRKECDRRRYRTIGPARTERKRHVPQTATGLSSSNPDGSQGRNPLQLRLPILRTGRSFGLTGGLRQRPCDAFGQPSQQMRSSRSPCSEHSVHLRGIECVRAKTCVSMSMCMCALASRNQSVAISEMRIERGTHQSLLSSSGRSLHARRQWWGKLPMVRGAQSPIGPRNDMGHTLS